MKKYLFFPLFLFAVSAVIFGFDYWWVDVYVEDFVQSRSERPSTQRVYFFKDLRSFQEATMQYDFNWTSHTRQPYMYQRDIYKTMRSEGFSYAFVLVERGVPVNRNQANYWIYAAYTFRNGSEYVDFLTREFEPIRF
jgi:hypothetical protein